jgi:hypothetical protein
VRLVHEIVWAAVDGDCSLAPLRFGRIHLARGFKCVRDLDTEVAQYWRSRPCRVMVEKNVVAISPEPWLAANELPDLAQGRPPRRANRARRDLAPHCGQLPGVNSLYVDGGGHSSIVNRDRDLGPVTSGNEVQAGCEFDGQRPGMTVSGRSGRLRSDQATRKLNGAMHGKGYPPESPVPAICLRRLRQQTRTAFFRKFESISATVERSMEGEAVRRAGSYEHRASSRRESRRIGGPALPPRMQRSLGRRSSGPLGGNRSVSARPASACRAWGVNAGSLPSGGSTIRDVRRLGTTLVPRSNQTSFVRAGYVGFAASIPAIAIIRFEKCPFVFRCLLLRKELFVSQFRAGVRGASASCWSRCPGDRNARPRGPAQPACPIESGDLENTDLQNVTRSHHPAISILVMSVYPICDSERVRSGL